MYATTAKRKRNIQKRINLHLRGKIQTMEDLIKQLKTEICTLRQISTYKNIIRQKGLASNEIRSSR